MELIDASKKVNEKIVHCTVQDRRQKHDALFQLGQLVRTADIKEDFSKGDCTNWTYDLYRTTQINHDTIPSCKVNFLAESYNENLLKSSELTPEGNDQVLTELNIIQLNITE